MEREHMFFQLNTGRESNLPDSGIILIVGEAFRLPRGRPPYIKRLDRFGQALNIFLKKSLILRFALNVSGSGNGLSSTHGNTGPL